MLTFVMLACLSLPTWAEEAAGAEQADQRAQQRTDQQRQSGDLDRVTHRPPRIVFQEPPRIRILSSFSSNVICAYPPDSPVNSRSAAPTKPVQQW